MDDIIDEFEKESAEEQKREMEYEFDIPKGASEDTLRKLRDLNDSELDELLDRFGIPISGVSGSELTREEKIVLLAQEDDKELRRELGSED
ncbi:MAG: hypothetical protein Q8P15_00255 [Nanoarchaeota archaeon]|nr:hypothetical protein [Nanoarchaeota archaeon]